MKLYEIISIFTYGLSKLIPKKKNRWIFGAWFGNAVSDNTKALYDYIAEVHPEIERVWVASDPARVDLPGCTVVKRNSLSSLRYILTAKVAVMNQGFGDFAAYNFLGGTYKAQLWHGVAWKKIGRDAVDNLKGVHEKVYQLINHYDLYIAPSEPYGESVKTAFKTDASRILYTGQPRNEVLFSADYRAESRRMVLDCLGIKDRKLIAYMPTFRDKTSEVFSFQKLENDSRLIGLARKYGFVIIEKLHFKSMQQSDGDRSERIVHAVPGIEAARLLGAADLLITDYSSCFLDYLITDRPVIHFAYDYEYYKNKDRGLYYDIEEIAAGTVVDNPDALLDAIEQNLAGDPEAQRRKAVRDRFITYEAKGSRKEICDRILADIG